MLRGGLVVGEVALSVMLLVGASLMMRTLMAVQGLRLGFDPERVLLMRLPLSRERYPDPERRVRVPRGSAAAHRSDSGGGGGGDQHRAAPAGRAEFAGGSFGQSAAGQPQGADSSRERATTRRRWGSGWRRDDFSRRRR